MTQEITLLDAHQQWASDAAPIIVDIRDAQSFAQGHIPGSIQLNNDNVAEFISNTDGNTHIIVVCYHGISSQQAASVLQQNGLTNTFSMQGGFTAWQKQFPDDIEAN